MTKIIKSILILVLLTSLGGVMAKSGAWFTDQEKVLGNSVSTGTVDIAVDGNNAATVGVGYSLVDLKPSQHGYINEIVSNVGTNPLNLYKSAGLFVESEVLQSEPKCVEIDGTWDGKTCTGGTLPTDLASRINYDLRVELYNGDPQTAKLVWWETIYLDSDAKKLSDLGKVYLGMVPSGWSMKVMQSYHMPSQEGTLDNKYQGEKLTFDMTFDAQQLTNTLALENKYLSDTDVSHHVWNLGGISDGIDGSVSYDVRDKAFNYTGTSEGVSGDYTMIAWDNSAKGYSWNWNDSADAIILAHVTGGVGFSGSVDINRNLTNTKLWLVPGNIGTVGSVYGSVLPWNPTQTLFDTGLIDYYDADI